MLVLVGVIADHERGEVPVRQILSVAHVNERKESLHGGVGFSSGGRTA